MTKVMQIHEHGGPEVLSWDDAPLSDPGPGEALIRHTAIGFNFVDTYHRSGQLGHKVTFPLVLGSQGVGVVEALGEPGGAGGNGLKAGDKVTYANLLGSYAEARIVPADRMVILPDDISDELAAAAYLRTLTAEYLLPGGDPPRGQWMRCAWSRPSTPSRPRSRRFWRPCANSPSPAPASAPEAGASADAARTPCHAGSHSLHQGPRAATRAPSVPFV